MGADITGFTRVNTVMSDEIEKMCLRSITNGKSTTELFFYVHSSALYFIIYDKSTVYSMLVSADSSNFACRQWCSAVLTYRKPSLALEYQTEKKGKNMAAHSWLSSHVHDWQHVIERHLFHLLLAHTAHTHSVKCWNITAWVALTVMSLSFKFLTTAAQTGWGCF